MPCWHLYLIYAKRYLHLGSGRDGTALNDGEFFRSRLRQRIARSRAFQADYGLSYSAFGPR
jgi:hypothetical protein